MAIRRRAFYRRDELKAAIAEVPAKLDIDHNVGLDEHFHGAPCTLIGQKPWCRAMAHTLDRFHQGRRMASHPRSF